MAEEKAPANRDGAGRFVKGQSGNPRGRAPLPPNFKEYAKKAPEELWAIANDEGTPVKVRTDILKWMTEMWYGKAPQAMALEGKMENVGVQVVKFEGALEEWSE